MSSQRSLLASGGDRQVRKEHRGMIEVRTTGRASAVAGAHPSTGSLVLQSLPGRGWGWRPQAALQSIPCTEEPQHSGIKGALSLRPLSHFKDTRVTEQCHLADGRSCLGEGESLALLPSQRRKTFSLS